MLDDLRELCVYRDCVFNTETEVYTEMFLVYTE